MSLLQGTQKLFTPLKLGELELSHRIILGPLTRSRSPDGKPTSMVAEYYAQRATPGGLQISEGVLPSFMAGNLLNVPCIYTPEHVQAWKRVTDAVHAKGGFIFCQLWHVGRFAHSSRLNGRQPLSASATNANSMNRFTETGYKPTETAREMTIAEIKETIGDHVHASKYAIEAGFDGVEITAGNGWLADQFLNSNTNKRTDAYGGSTTNRARFTLELLDAIASTIGPAKTAVRFSPFGVMVMPLDSDPLATFSYVISEVEKRGLAYVCLSQPRTDMFLDETKKWEVLYAAVGEGKMKVSKEDISLKPFTKLLNKTPVFAGGNYDNENCFHEVENGDLDGVSFGRWSASNPDLVERLRGGSDLTPYIPEFFYSSGEKGYTDYPVANANAKVVN